MFPIRRLPAPLGDVTVTAAATIAKSTSLTSPTDAASFDETRMRAFADTGPVTIQTNEPVVAPLFGTEAAIATQEAPPSRVSSRRTRELMPRLWLQLIDRGVPAAHCTAVFGEVTRIVAP